MVILTEKAPLLSATVEANCWVSCLMITAAPLLNPLPLIGMLAPTGPLFWTGLLVEAVVKLALLTLTPSLAAIAKVPAGVVRALIVAVKFPLMSLVIAAGTVTTEIPLKVTAMGLARPNPEPVSVMAVPEVPL